VAEGRGGKAINRDRAWAGMLPGSFAAAGRRVDNKDLCCHAFIRDTFASKLKNINIIRVCAYNLHEKKNPKA
jgi:hypothetical protein